MSPKVTAQLKERTFKYILHVDHACWQNFSVNICFNFLLFCLLSKVEITRHWRCRYISLTREHLITYDGLTSLMSWRGKWKLKIRPLFWKILLILHKFFNAIFYDKNGKVGFLTPSICQAANRLFSTDRGVEARCAYDMAQCMCRPREGTAGEGESTLLKYLAPPFFLTKKACKFIPHTLWNSKWRCCDCSSWGLHVACMI